MIRALAAASAVLALALAPPVSASHDCEGRGLVLDAAGTAYVALDRDPAWTWYLPWVYVESNGQSGLQRGGATLLGDADVCQDSPTPDQGVL